MSKKLEDFPPLEGTRESPKDLPSTREGRGRDPDRLMMQRLDELLPRWLEIKGITLPQLVERGGAKKVPNKRGLSLEKIAPPPLAQQLQEQKRQKGKGRNEKENKPPPQQMGATGGEKNRPAVRGDRPPQKGERSCPSTTGKRVEQQQPMAHAPQEGEAWTKVLGRRAKEVAKKAQTNSKGGNKEKEKNASP